MITVETNMMHWQGLTELTYESFTPLALMNFDPAGIIVPADSEYETAQDLLDAIKAAPKGEFKASGTGQGGIWHVALGAMLESAGLPPDHVQWVPSTGASAGLQDMVAGGVDIAPCSLPEARALIDAGKVKSLAIMNDKPAALYPNVPTLKAALGSDWTTAAWRGMVAPKGTPTDARDRLAGALQKIVASKDYTDFMSSRGFGVIYAGPDDFAKFMAKSDAELGATMKALGIAK
jgi:tripartite-type tricarboxylate transporter receptor subunit TctC